MVKYANNPQVWKIEAEKLGVQAHSGLHKTMPQKITYILDYFSVTIIKTMIKSKMGKKGFISGYRSQSIIKGSQGRSSRQELLLTGFLPASAYLASL